VSLFERRVDGFDSRGSLGVPRCVDWSIRRAFHQDFGQEANGADEVAGFGILAREDVERYTRVRVLPEYRVHERKAVGDCVQCIQVSINDRPELRLVGSAGGRWGFGHESSRSRQPDDALEVPRVSTGAIDSARHVTSMTMGM